MQTCCWITVGGTLGLQLVRYCCVHPLARNKHRSDLGQHGNRPYMQAPCSARCCPRTAKLNVVKVAGSSQDFIRLCGRILNFKEVMQTRYKSHRISLPRSFAAPHHACYCTLSGDTLPTCMHPPSISTFSRACRVEHALHVHDLMW